MSIRSVQCLLAAVVCCFMLATGFISFAIADRQKALQQVARYEATWSASQVVSEFMRLEHRLAAYAIPGSPVDLDEVRLRLDIMFSRLQALQGGDLREFIGSAPRHAVTVDNLTQALETVDESISAPSISFPDVLKALEALAPLDAQLSELASAAREFGTAGLVEDQAALISLHRTFTGLAAGLIACGVVLIVLLFYHNRLLGRAHGDLRTLADHLSRTSEELRLQNSRFDAALNNMSQALCTFDAGGRLVIFNDRFAALTALFDRLQPGSGIDTILADADKQDVLSTFHQLYAEQFSLVRERRQAVFTHKLPDGRAFAVSHEPLADGGWLATYEDISERQRAEARIAHMAHHDPLTDLPNRILFREELDRKLLQAKSESGRFAVYCLDLDGFKDVNDTLGHHVGDELLKLVADRLRSCIGHEEIVARLGGDEFALVCSSSPQPSHSLQRAHRLISELSRPYFIEGQEIAIGVSVGVAEYPQHSSGPDELLKHADLALYQAKADGKGRARQFEAEMDTQIQDRKAFETDLRKALQRGEMQVYYQPLVDVRTRDIRGYEALLRWKHPVRGQVSPVEFIPTAESIGIIGVLGEWVLRQACTEAAGWPSQATVAVNLSPVQFRTNTLTETVIEALASSGLQPDRLELEITESVLLDASERTISTLHDLKGLGVRIAMDDFGTGYSSLSNLLSFPFDKIKIDRSFIQDLTTRPDALSIVRLIIALGVSLGMSTTAEGVETEEQFACLKAVGCTQVQGYLFARPKPASELVHLAEVRSSAIA